MRVFLVLAVLVVGAWGGVREKKPGIIDGYQSTEYSDRMSSGWYTWKKLIPASITSDTIKFDSLYGNGYFVRQVTNTTARDGIFIGITSVGDPGPCPVISYQPSGVLPSITKILKAGTTIDTMLLFIQVVKDTSNR